MEGQTQGLIDVVASGGATGLLGWLAATLWNAYRRWTKLADKQEKLIDAQLEQLADHVRKQPVREDRAARVAADIRAIRTALASDL